MDFVALEDSFWPDIVDIKSRSEYDQSVIYEKYRITETFELLLQRSHRQ